MDNHVTAVLSFTASKLSSTLKSIKREDINVHFQLSKSIRLCKRIEHTENKTKKDISDENGLFFFNKRVINKLIKACKWIEWLLPCYYKPAFNLCPFFPWTKSLFTILVSIQCWALEVSGIMCHGGELRRFMQWQMLYLVAPLQLFVVGNIRYSSPTCLPAWGSG